MDNARVINNIMSVPNRIGLKRNQVFNETYQKHLSDLEETSKKTAYDLDSLMAELKRAEDEKISNHKEEKEEVEETPTGQSSSENQAKEDSQAEIKQEEKENDDSATVTDGQEDLKSNTEKEAGQETTS